MPEELGHPLTPLSEVQETILAHVQPVATEPVALNLAAGRVLREGVQARDAVPSFDNSAMDGFVVRVADLQSASESAPVTLPVAGTVAAGDAGESAVQPNTAWRIMTGAPVPPGGEAVIPHELTRHSATSVTFSKSARPGQNVRRAGEDLQPGDAVLEPGIVLRPTHIGLIATAGCSKVTVNRQIKVAILTPGEELVGVDTELNRGQIRNSNSFSLAALIQELGMEPYDLGVLPDSKSAIEAAIARGIAAGADAFISTGGVSAGDFDYVQAVVREKGQPGHVFKVNMRPGKPQAFGVFDGRPFFGLPGNPAASVLSFEILVRPALRKMRGESDCFDSTFQVRFPLEYRYKPGRLFLLRARVEPDPEVEGGELVVLPPAAQGSNRLAAFASVNAIIFLPEDQNVVPAGATRPAIWLSGRP